MILTFDAAGPTLGRLDLGTDGDDGDLTATGGNLYLYVDGQEVGSLWFTRNVDGRMEVTLGRYEVHLEDWHPNETLPIPEAPGE